MAAQEKDLSVQLLEIDACREAIAWSVGRTPALAWAECERGDWMLWLVGKLSVKPGCDARRKLVLCACECARLALPHVRAGEERPRRAIETAERWAGGEEGVTLDDVLAARAAAYAAYAADADAAAYAAYAAATATASAATATADAAADAATSAAAYEDTKATVLKQCADIIRRHYPSPPTLPTV